MVKPSFERAITGHGDKGMIYTRYGRYRDGLYEEREEILAYMGADALLADELNVFRSAGVRKAEEETPRTNRKATVLSTENLSDKFSGKMWLRTDNYP